MAELLLLPALLGYGEAAVAYVGEARRPGVAGRLAIWGVRIGWLAHTALLVAEVERERAFPWASRGGALNLLVWLVVGVYLIWGCKPRFRLLGLAVMPPAALLLLLAVAVGPAGVGEASTPFLVAHVGLILAAVAGFAVAAGLAGFYLWEERQLKRRASVLRLRVPPLDALDRLTGRTIGVSLVALTLGMTVGLFALDRIRLDAAMALTVAAWFVFAAALALRYEAGWRGRRGAYLVLAGFILAAAALPVAHFA
jgi:ABC-type uncharacterized transport system permease subunit